MYANLSQVQDVSYKLEMNNYGAADWNILNRSTRKSTGLQVFKCKLNKGTYTLDQQNVQTVATAYCYNMAYFYCLYPVVE